MAVHICTLLLGVPTKLANAGARRKVLRWDPTPTAAPTRTTSRPADTSTTDHDQDHTAAVLSIWLLHLGRSFSDSALLNIRKHRH